MGLSADALDALASGVWGYGAERLQKVDAAAAGIDRDAPGVRRAFALAEQIAGFPRHLSQHVGGFVVTRGRLDELVPIQNAAMEDRTVIEWDKDDIDALGILKIDVLGLGMLTCLRNALDLLQRQYGRELTLATIPAEDPAVYRMLSRADSLGVFQVESRAQMSMLPRLKPRTFYDLVIEVAIVRPGPIQGDMVHPYLRRRQGLEPVSFPSAALEEVLGKTLGVPLFQEQAMKIAIVAAGFTPSEADRLRRAMATFRKVGTIGTFQAKMIEGMVVNGYDRAFAERCFRQIEGFGEYGFPESHAASFALLVYASSWFKCHYPDVFAAALLNSQPLGFYAPAQIVRDAREHGVAAREVDVNHSAWDATLEPCDLGELQPRHAEMAGEILSNCAIRLGFREIKGLPAAAAASITQHRGGGYDSVRDLWLRTGLQASTLEQLADADAFGSLGLTRRDALWAVRALGRTGDDDDLPLFAAVVPGQRREPDADLPPMPLGEEVVNDYRSLRLSLKAHPVSFMRHRLDWRRVTPCMRLGEVANGARVAVAGLVLVRQRPGTAKGVIFATLEDEGGIANVIVWPKVFERYRKVVLGARVLLVTGTLQSEHGVIHVVARHLEDATGMLAELTADLTGVDPVMPADEVKRPEPGSKRGRAASEKSRTDPASSAARDAMPKGRNFH
jgi:error-prone DNA polymerase